MEAENRMGLEWRVSVKRKARELASVSGGSNLDVQVHCLT
jgi:hypothetical protein